MLWLGGVVGKTLRHTTISAPSHLEYEFSIRNPSILDHIHLRIISIPILISAEDSEQ